MRIAAFMDCEAGVGGGFHQALAAVLQVQRLVEGRFDLLVFTAGSQAAEELAGLGIRALALRAGWRDRGLGLGARSEVGRRVQRRLGVTGSFEAELLRQGVDLVYFVSPSPRVASLQELNYVVTVLDLCHRDHPEFPEVREGYEFHRRETFYRSFLPPAVAVLADSASMAESLVETYGLQRERVLPMPYSPSPFLAEERARPTAEVLSGFGLEPGYLFYPAQFWAHKNHVRILQALAILRDQGVHHRVVFSGGDQGTLGHVQDLAGDLGLRESVAFLGFVSGDALRGLYEGCRAVVMPTYFGPTNLPPLEAFALGRPLLYSSHLAASLSGAALTFDPDDAAGLARAIQALDDPGSCRQAIQAGAAHLDRLREMRSAAEDRLVGVFESFAKKRQCWR